MPGPSALSTDDGRVRERCDVRIGRRGSHSGKRAQIFPEQEVRHISAVTAGPLLLSLTTSCGSLLQPTRIVLRVQHPASCRGSRQHPSPNHRRDRLSCYSCPELVFCCGRSHTCIPRTDGQQLAGRISTHLQVRSRQQKPYVMQDKALRRFVSMSGALLRLQMKISIRLRACRHEDQT